MKNFRFLLKNGIEIGVIILYLCVSIYIFPISSALLIAYLLYPFPHFITKKFKIPYFISTFLSIGIFFFIVWKIFVLFIHSILKLAPMLYDLVQSIQLPSQLNPYVQTLNEQLINFVEKQIQVMLLNIPESINSIFQYLLFLFALLFALLESRHDRHWFFVFVPSVYRERWIHYFQKVSKLFQYFLFVELTLFSVTLCCLFLLFSAIQFPHAISIAFLLALADLLPMLGLGLFFIPISLYFFLADQFMLASILIISYVCIIMIRQLIDSKLWASSFKIRTTQSFVIMAASVLLFGFYGLLLSPILLMLYMRLKQTSYF